MGRRVRTTPRKRPKQARSAATVEAILTATARILAKVGFERATTNQIARVAGVSIGSLYQYFPNKEALVATLVERHVAAISTLLDAAYAELKPEPVPTAARGMVEIMMRIHAVDPALYRVLVEQVPRIGRLKRMQEVERRFTELTRAYLEAHRDEITPTDLDLAAFLVVQMLEALAHAAVVHLPDRLADATLVDEVTAVVVRYLTG